MVLEVFTRLTFASAAETLTPTIPMLSLGRGWRKWSMAQTIPARYEGLARWNKLAAELEVEELLAESFFLFRLCPLGLFAGIFFAKTGRLPGVDLCLGVVGGGKGLFFADGIDPVIHGYLVSGLHLVEIRDFNGHRSPR